MYLTRSRDWYRHSEWAHCHDRRHLGHVSNKALLWIGGMAVASSAGGYLPALGEDVLWFLRVILTTAAVVLD